MSAYDILDQLRDDGIKAPLQVYRALDTLQKQHFVHKLESINAFVACSKTGCHTGEMSAFMICSDCKSVIELHDHKLSNGLQNLVETKNFTPTGMVVEVHGNCSNCVASGQQV